MTLSLYQVDAFADKLFSGNPAAVVPVEKMPEDSVMQNIAMENNLAETAFIAPSSKEGFDYDIRWFTPAAEIDLCGHATLASAYVLFHILKFPDKYIRFSSKSGLLSVTVEGEMIMLDFPSWIPTRYDEYPSMLKNALGGAEILGVFKNRDLLVELPDQQTVSNCTPDFNLIKTMGSMVIITAPGKEVDFVSRFFAPTVGIDEDPATGSAHSQLIPFWAERLQKTKMKARQLSSRGADFTCQQLGERVKMGGKCIYYMKGEIYL